MSHIEVILGVIALILLGAMLRKPSPKGMARSHKVQSSSGIMMAGKHAFDPRMPMFDEKNQRVDSVEVFLPNQPMDEQEKLYALYLLNHPAPDVNVHFTEEQLWDHR